MSADQRLVNDRIVSSLRSAVRDGGVGLSDVPGLLKKVIREDAWKERVIRTTGEVAAFGRFVEFVQTPPLEGLGTDLETLKRLCRDDAEALDALDKVTTNRPGGDTIHSNIMNGHVEAQQGTTRQYALRKLRKDAPDLHTRVLAGEISPNAAMIEAGFRQKTITVPLDPERAAQTLMRHFTQDECTAIGRRLLGELL